MDVALESALVSRTSSKVLLSRTACPWKVSAIQRFTASLDTMKTTSLQRFIGALRSSFALAVLATTASLESAGSLHAEGPAVALPTRLSEIGARVAAGYHGDASGIDITPEGVRLRAAFQKLAGTVSSEGLWVGSTEGAGGGLRLVARSVGRGGNSTALARVGTVAPGQSVARFFRPGLTEEYSVSVDGVRQDFVLAERPSGSGDLSVELALSGARAEACAQGARLVLQGSGRALVYSRLRVTDASGRELSASLQVLSDDRLAVRVTDASAVYPVRIDPTFSDANWAILNPGTPGVSDAVYATVVDGSGNLYIGGAFTLAGGGAANYIAKWDGTTWSALGGGLNAPVRALAVMGTDVYAGGDFTFTDGPQANHIAKWSTTSSTWSAVAATPAAGMDDSVYALAVSGSTLYAGGAFTTADGNAASSIAQWDGTAWSALGSGTGDRVYALAVIGTDLYAGGSFNLTDGGPADYIAKWSAGAWTSLGAGMDSTVRALAVIGTDLYAGGDFSLADGVTANSIAKWSTTNSVWSTLGAGMDNSVHALAVDGTNLYAGGLFSTAGVAAANSVALWNGTAWSGLSNGVDNTVHALAVSGGNLYSGGAFTAAGGGVIPYFAKWNGTAWSALGTGLNDVVKTLAVNGTNLYVGGAFTTSAGAIVSRILKWDGTAWSALGSGMDGDVNALLVSGSTLYAGGSFTSAGGVANTSHIAQWNGTAWSALGIGVDGDVWSLALSGSNLYVGGAFANAGAATANRIAQWDGSTWSALGAGFDDGVVFALAVSGSNLYAGGSFTTMGGNPASGIMQWSGGAWSGLGAGANGNVYALAVSGANLYAGGSFSTMDGVTVNDIAMWDGSAWTALGSGFDNGAVKALAVTSTALYAGGSFASSNSVAINYIAEWDGVGGAWAGLGSGTSDTVVALAATGTTLYVGGDFFTAGAKQSPFLAKVSVPAPDITVEQPVGTGLADGVSTIDFGILNVSSAGGATTFTVTNPGTADLSSLSVSVDGANAGDFAVDTTAMLTTVPASNTTTFSITFTPSAGGLRRAALHIASNVAGTKNPFDVNLTGIGDTLAFASPMFTVTSGPTGTNADIVVSRLGTTGAVACSISTTSGTAVTPAQYQPPASSAVNIPAASSTVHVLVPIAANATLTTAKTFTVTLNNPTGGTTLGTPVIATVVILPPASATDHAKPTVTLTTPANKASLIDAPSLVLHGTATDNIGIRRVQVSLDNGATFADATLTSPGQPSTAFSFSMNPVTGLNTIQVKATDFNGNTALISSVFTQLRTLTVSVVGPVGSGSVSTGFSPSSSRLVGSHLSITATPKHGFVFDGWTLSGGPTPSQIGATTASLELPVLSFIMQEHLSLTANFIANPFTAPIIGAFNGLVVPSPADPAPNGTATALDTVGMLANAVVTGTGAFTSNLKIAGLSLPVVGTFDNTGAARFGTARATSLTLIRPGSPSLNVDLQLDMTGTLNTITGHVTQIYHGALVASSDVTADRAGYSASSKVPATLAGTLTKPYTLIFPSRAQSPALDTLYYPQGDGFATMTVNVNGTVSLTGKLAENTVITASAPLSGSNQWPVFAQLYGTKGCLGGMASLVDGDASTYDVTGFNFLWVRPHQTVQWYPDGWPDGILVDLIGARYAVPAASPPTSVFPGLQSISPNATLIFADGQLTAPISHDITITTGNLATNIPNATLVITKATGLISGTFTHTDHTTPAYQGVILQKGADAGASGYFMTVSPKVLDYLGESGAVQVLAK